MKALVLLFAALTVSALQAGAVTGYPQEKIQLVTNGERFVTGDTVRFRAFLQDAATGAEARDLSRYVYVELLDPFGTVHERVKVRANSDGVFAGILPLDRELPESRYTLAAYTTYMQNQGPEYFCRKPLDVRSMYAYKYKIEPEFFGRTLSVRLTELESGRPVESESLLLYGPEGLLTDAGRKKSAYRFKIPKDVGTVKVRFDNYSKFIAIPADSSAIRVEFFPEGGALVAGVSNAVAFRAVDADGRPVDVRGTIADGYGSIVAELATRANGIGQVRFIPADGETYSATVAGRTYRLPAATADATALQVVATRPRQFIVDLLGRKPATAILAASVRGDLQLLDTVASFPVAIPKSSLSAGPVEFLLLDGEGRTLSARRAYNYAPAPAAVSITDLPKGSYAISLSADTVSLSGATTAEAAMLRSDLADFVPDLDCYFSDRDDHAVRADMDALMLAARSGRYADGIRQMLAGTLAEPAYPVEVGGEISGVIKSRWRGKPMANAKINIIAPAIGVAQEAPTDAEGRFSLTGIDWPDGTVFACQAINSKGDREHNFEIAADTFPAVTPLPMPVDAIEYTPENADQLVRSGILLRELQVTAPRTPEESLKEMYAAMGIRTFGPEELDAKKITSYEEVIRSIPGLSIKNGAIFSNRRNSIYGGPAKVEIWVDGVQWTPSTISTKGTLPTPKYRRHSLSSTNGRFSVAEPIVEPQVHTADITQIDELSSSYPFSIIESIKYAPPHAALIYSNTAALGGGALVITTKSGKGTQWDTDLLIRPIEPLGYQNNKEAYRATKKWKPAATKREAEKSAAKAVTISGFTENGNFITATLKD